MSDPEPDFHSIDTVLRLLGYPVPEQDDAKCSVVNEEEPDEE